MGQNKFLLSCESVVDSLDNTREITDATVWAGTGKKQLGIRVGVVNRSRYFTIIGTLKIGPRLSGVISLMDN